MTIGSAVFNTNFQTIQPQIINSNDATKPDTTTSKLQEEHLEKSNPNDPQSYEDDPQIKQIIVKLKARDTEVRAHEAAHIAAGAGVVTGGASFTYQKGPDGNLYAIGGEVPIDVSTESSPEQTVQKMQKVQAAALAPADPSPADIKIASTAAMLEARAQEELRKEQEEELKERVGVDEKEKNSNIETYKEFDQYSQLSRAV